MADWALSWSVVGALGVATGAGGGGGVTMFVPGISVLCVGGAGWKGGGGLFCGAGSIGCGGRYTSAPGR